MWFLWFIIYSFMGWLYESVLCSITGGKLTNRGFLTGPICPIYGFGAVAVLVMFYPFPMKFYLLFLFSAVITTTIEYITSVLLEKIFHTRWWDYTEQKLNIKGRVCILGTIVFGTFSVLLVKIVHPFIIEVTSAISKLLLFGLCGVIVAVGTVDFIVTIMSFVSLEGRLKELEEQILGFLDSQKKRTGEWKATLVEKFETSEFYTERVKKLLDHKSFQQSRLMKAFPKMKSIRYYHALEKIRDKVNGRLK
ncbi:putative ABC transporter permease [Anaeromicropila populeti]|nr:putative ABC transporter permease [Anaeromicropila populeti]